MPTGTRSMPSCPRPIGRRSMSIRVRDGGPYPSGHPPLRRRGEMARDQGTAGISIARAGDRQHLAAAWGNEPGGTWTDRGLAGRGAGEARLAVENGIVEGVMLGHL